MLTSIDRLLPPEDDMPPLWVKEGLPPLTNRALIEVPNESYTFIVNLLTTLNSKGSVIKTFRNLRVILAHGIYDKQNHWHRFANQQPIRATVLSYNKANSEDPIQFVVACTGSQSPINYESTAENYIDDTTFAGGFLPWEQVGMCLLSDVSVTLIQNSDGEIEMTVQVMDNNGGFINLDNIGNENNSRDLADQIIIEDQ